MYLLAVLRLRSWRRFQKEDDRHAAACGLSALTWHCATASCACGATCLQHWIRGGCNCPTPSLALGPESPNKGLKYPQPDLRETGAQFCGLTHLQCGTCRQTGAQICGLTHLQCGTCCMHALDACCVDAGHHTAAADSCSDLHCSCCLPRHPMLLLNASCGGAHGSISCWSDCYSGPQLAAPLHFVAPSRRSQSGDGGSNTLQPDSSDA